MDVMCIFQGLEYQQEVLNAEKYAMAVPEHLLLQEIQVLEEAEVKFEELMTKDYYTAQLDEDEVIWFGKEMWRARFRLVYLRARYSGLPIEDDADKDEEMIQEEQEMDEVTELLLLASLQK
jgi:hypothetical protein